MSSAPGADAMGARPLSAKPRTTGGAVGRQKLAVIVGCGRVGIYLATGLSEAGYLVKVLDLESSSLDRLPKGMIAENKVVAVLGDGTLEKDLARASIEDADVCIAVTGKDATNGLAAQLAQQLFEVQRVICRINEPARQRMYRERGLLAVSAAALFRDAVLSLTSE